MSESAGKRIASEVRPVGSRSRWQPAARCPLARSRGRAGEGAHDALARAGGRSRVRDARADQAEGRARAFARHGRRRLCRLAPLRLPRAEGRPCAPRASLRRGVLPAAWTTLRAALPAAHRPGHSCPPACTDAAWFMRAAMRARPGRGRCATRGRSRRAARGREGREWGDRRPPGPDAARYWQLPLRVHSKRVRRRSSAWTISSRERRRTWRT